MTAYVDSALFLHSAETAPLRHQVESFSADVATESMEITEFLNREPADRPDFHHLVLCAPTSDIKDAMECAIAAGAGIGILPLPSQKLLLDGLDLPTQLPDQLDLALRSEATAMDLLRCNGHIILSRCTIGRVPVLDGREGQTRWQAFRRAIRRFVGIRLLGFSVTTAELRGIDTAACGVIVANPRSSGLASRFIQRYGNQAPGTVSAPLASATSIVSYLSFMWALLLFRKWPRRLPSATGLVQSTTLTIAPETSLNVNIDGELLSTTPAQFEVDSRRIKLNTGRDMVEARGTAASPIQGGFSSSGHLMSSPGT